MLPADTVFCSHVSRRDRFTQIKQKWDSEGESVSLIWMTEIRSLPIMGMYGHVYKCIKVFLFFVFY